MLSADRSTHCAQEETWMTPSDSRVSTSTLNLATVKIKKKRDRWRGSKCIGVTVFPHAHAYCLKSKAFWTPYAFPDCHSKGANKGSALNEGMKGCWKRKWHINWYPALLAFTLTLPEERSSQSSSVRGKHKLRRVLPHVHVHLDVSSFSDCVFTFTVMIRALLSSWDLLAAHVLAVVTALFFMLKTHLCFEQS